MMTEMLPMSSSRISVILSSFFFPVSHLFISIIIFWARAYLLPADDVSLQLRDQRRLELRHESTEQLCMCERSGFKGKDNEGGDDRGREGGREGGKKGKKEGGME